MTGCTRTSDNTLSVWLSNTKDFNSESVEKLVVALATTMNEPATIDLVWLEPEWLSQKGITISTTLGDTRYKTVNELHRDISALNHKKLADVGEHILVQLENKENYKRYLKNELIALVLKWQKIDKDFEFEELGPKWQKVLDKLAVSVK
ncbi:hypothetical protein CQ001_19130 [Erwinia billingiae]|nr:hypothetical protein CQ001_19130 [Erwinia billingiae]